MNSSDDDDIIEIVSSTKSERNLKSENQSEAEIANNSLNVTNDTSETEVKESKQETSKRQEKANKVAEGDCLTCGKPIVYTEKRAGETKSSIPEKSHRKLVVKDKLLKKRLVVITRHQKRLQFLAADLNRYLKN